MNKSIFQHKRLVDGIASYLREAILSGKYPAGTILSQKSIAEELNVSRTPVREALRKLENESLVVFEKNRQIKVRTFDYQYLIELYHVREMIDGLAARLLAEQCRNPKFVHSIEKLEENLKEMKEIIKNWDSDQWNQCNAKFHIVLVEETGNRPLISQIPLLRMSAEMFHPTVVRHPKRAEDAFNEHRLILDAIKHGECDLAENLARLHIRSARRFIVQLASQSTKE